MVASRLHRNTSAILALPILKGEDDPVSPLRAAVELQAGAAALIAAAVDRARDAGCTWQDIGAALGTTRQAAFQRYGKPIDPRTGETMNTTPLPEASGLAQSVIDDLSRGRWEEIVRRFDGQMRERLTADNIAAAWAQVSALAGAYEHCGQTGASRAVDITVTDTPLAFEAGDFTARISFRDDKTIAGLFILPAEETR